MTITTYSYPRAAVIGNPSDGYFGKTIAFVFDNFYARVELVPSEFLKIIPNERDQNEWKNLNDLFTKINQFGYYGGVRLIKAGLKKFVEFCNRESIVIAQKNFSISYFSNIPNRLGMAGSSAIITALFKAIFQFYQIEVSKEKFANLVLSVELEELKIGAGLQDRVAQSFEQPVFMNFEKNFMDKNGFGQYQTFPKSWFPKFYIAYREASSEGSEVVHNNLRERWEKGNKEVVNAMLEFSKLTSSAFDFMKGGEAAKLRNLMDANFDLRKSIINISKENLEMVVLARSTGASAKFTGSGGAIIGTYENESMFENLNSIFTQNRIKIFKPNIVENGDY